MELNKYFFEALRIRLENILRPLSLNYQARIIYGDSPCTDVQNTVILPARSEIIPGKLLSLAELYVSYKAMTAHEGAHIRYTSLSAWKKATQKGPIFQHLTNCIEDGRIEALISEQLPGAGRWIRFINNYIYHNRLPESYGTGFNAFFNGLVVYSVCLRIPPFLPKDIIKTIKKAAPYVDIGKAASCTEDVLPQVEAIIALPEVKELISKMPPLPSMPDIGSSNPHKDSSTKARERAEKAKKLIKAREEKVSETEPQSNNSPTGKTDASQSPASDDSSDESKKPSAESINESNNNPIDEQKNDNSNMEKTYPDEPVPETDNSNEDVNEGNSNNPNNQDSTEDCSEKDSLADAKNQTPVPGDNALNNSEGDFNFNSNPAPGENQEENFFAEPDEEDFDDLIEASDKEISTLANEAKEMEKEDQEPDLLEGVSSPNAGFEVVDLKPDPAKYQGLVKKNQTLIKNLVKEIEVALETRKAYDLRNLNRGRLTPSSLWKLAVPDTSVFSRRIIPGNTPELAVYVLVDCSGSMCSFNNDITRIESAKNTACVLTETCKILKIKHAVTGFDDDGETTSHYPAVLWDDEDSSRIVNLSDGLANRDGFSIRLAANELALRSEPRKILFVLSDGQPSTTDYHGKAALQDVKNAVIETKKRGIQVISLFFGDNHLIPDFRFMYDAPVFVQDINTLPRTLGEVFKRVLLQY